MLGNLQLRDFRCFDVLGIEWDPGFNFIIGANGEGKTSLLEAACVLLRLQSQRSSSLGPLIQLGARSFSVRGSYDSHAMEFRYSPLRRKVSFDDVEQRTPEDYLRVGRVVSFANTDIELVRGTADGRRRYLDFMGAQVLPTYRQTLRAYERALRSRNALLKQSSLPDRRAIAAYDRPLIGYGTRLREMRTEIVARIAPSAADAYRRISNNSEVLKVSFMPGSSDDLAADLKNSEAQEARLRQTIVGPHRDDMDLRVDEMQSSSFASEGQQRTVALALKMAQADVFSEQYEAPPMLLIDDVFGELDPQRRNALIDSLPRDSQKLVTATAIPWRDELPPGTAFRLRGRQVERA